jgi:nitrate reductase gamma subunit
MLYLITAAVSLLLALSLLLMPSVMLGVFGMAATKSAATLAQLIAVELTVSGVFTFLMRDTTDPKVRSSLNYANIVAGVLGVIVALNGTLTGAFGWFGYVILAIYLFMAVAFGYIQFFAWGE